MKDIRKALNDLLVISMNTDQMNHLGRDVDPNFDMARVSGFGEKIVIPRKVAADCILSYFASEEKLLEFIAYMISRNGQGASGGVIRLKGSERLLEMLRENKWIYDPRMARFHRDQSETKTSGWGFMKQGEDYSLAFCSIDIVSSSELVKTNVKVDVETTLKRLRLYVQSKVNSWNGRIWFWYGDGGLAAFYGESSVSQAVLSMITTLSYLPVFNISENELRPESDIKLRVGIHYGTVEYAGDTGKMSSPDLKLSQEIEKYCADANTIAISEAALNLLQQEIRSRFVSAADFNSMKTYKYYP